MDNVIIVSSTEKGNTVLTDFLRSQSFTVAGTISSGSEARRAFLEQAPDLVIINAPLIDEFGHELAMNIAETHVCGIILVVKTDVAEDVEAKVEDYGVVVVPKPINRAFFYHAVKMVLTARRRLMVLQTENVKLQQKIEEIRLISKMLSDPIFEHDGGTSAPAYRKAGDGYPQNPTGSGGHSANLRKLKGKRANHDGKASRGMRIFLAWSAGQGKRRASPTMRFWHCSTEGRRGPGSPF